MTYKKKLIEVALPLADISDASSKEKSVKHGHPANLHMWWARRPLAAARAVIWASLVDDPSANPERFPTAEAQQRERDRLFGILIRLVSWESTSDTQLLKEARAEIDRCYEGDPPRLLDPFGGGGAIPLEGQRLGLEVYSGDLNPVAVLIQKAMLEIPPRFRAQGAVHPDLKSELGSWRDIQGLAADIRAYGSMLGELALNQVSDFYPPILAEDGLEVSPLAWIWARTVKSPDPGWPHHVPLVKSWVLGKKPGRPVVWVSPEVDASTQTIHYRIRHGGSPAAGTISGRDATCLATGTAIPGAYIKAEAQSGRLGAVLIACVGEGKRGRVFAPPDARSARAAEVPGPEDAPSGIMSSHPQYMGTPRYGLDEWHKLYTPRQLRSLVSLSSALPTIRAQVRDDALRAGMSTDPVRLRDGGACAEAYADAVVTYLAFAIDKLADLNNSLARWEPVAQCPRQLFGRQSVSMVWDYAEAFPFSSSSGSLRVIVDGIARVLDGRAFSGSLAHARSGVVEQRDAAARIQEVDTCVVCTDPPYYAQVPYADIADFFYVWIRRNLMDVWPDECATLLTPKSDELVADEKRHGSKEGAAAFFEAGMERVFKQVAAVQDPRVPATIFYALKASEQGSGPQASTGWEKFLQGLLSSGMAVTGTWPIRTENKSRLRAMSSNALASSVVLACRPREVAAPMATRGDFIAALRAELEPAVRVLQQENIAPVDLAQSSIGPGIAIFSRYARVVEADGSTMTVRSALTLINEVLGEILSGEEAEFDADTRFALTWFEQFGHNPGPFGDADLLARAKDTTVAGVAEAGVVASRGGQVRLVERADLPEVWDPATDTRLTVWETTQHLIRAVESSELAAAALLARLGEGVGDRARQLAYLLYGICDRRNWAEEAVAYNMLVTAWPELTKLAAAPKGPVEETMF